MLLIQFKIWEWNPCFMDIILIKSNFFFQCKGYKKPAKYSTFKKQFLKNVGILDMIHLKMETSGSVSLEDSPCKDVVGDLFDMNEVFFKTHQHDVFSCSIPEKEFENCCIEIQNWLETTPDNIINSFFTTPRRSPLAPTSRRVLTPLSVRRNVLSDIQEEVNY